MTGLHNVQGLHITQGTESDPAALWKEPPKSFWGFLQLIHDGLLSMYHSLIAVPFLPSACSRACQRKRRLIFPHTPGVLFLLLTKHSPYYLKGTSLTHMHLIGCCCTYIIWPQWPPHTQKFTILNLPLSTPKFPGLPPWNLPKRVTCQGMPT